MHGLTMFQFFTFNWTDSHTHILTHANTSGPLMKMHSDKYKDTAAELVNSMSSAPKPNPGMYSSGMNQPNTVSPVVDVNSIGPDNAVPVQNPNQYEQQPAPQEPMQSTIQNPEGNISV